MNSSLRSRNKGIVRQERREARRGEEEDYYMYQTLGRLCGGKQVTIPGGNT